MYINGLASYFNEWMQDSNGFVDEKCENRLYIGNLDLRITEYANAQTLTLFACCATIFTYN